MWEAPMQHLADGSRLTHGKIGHGNILNTLGIFYPNPYLARRLIPSLEQIKPSE